MAFSKHKFVRLLLAFLILFLGSKAFSRTCGPIHQNLPKGLFDSLEVEHIENAKPRIAQLALKLLERNIELLAAHTRLKDLGPSSKWKVEEIEFQEPRKELPKYLEFEVHISGNGNRRRIILRTNGSVAFLSRSWVFRSEDEVRHYKAVFFQNRSIKSMSQGELILATLPETLLLSRSMAEGERQLWLNGGQFSSRYGAKLHFAPVYFKFNEEPYLIPFTRAELLEFYKNNELEVNTYDAQGGTRPPTQVWTDLGLEFEFVFFGKKALDKLAPKMKEHLRQRNIDFEFRR